MSQNIISFISIGRYNLTTLFKNPYFISFIIIGLLIFSLLFTSLSPIAKQKIISIILYPISIIIILTIILFIGQFNLLLATFITFILFWILLYQQSNMKIINNNIESFSNNDNDIDNDDDDDKNKKNEDKYVNGIKNLFTGKIREMEKKKILN